MRGPSGQPPHSKQDAAVVTEPLALLIGGLWAAVRVGEMHQGGWGLSLSRAGQGMSRGTTKTFGLLSQLLFSICALKSLEI